MSRNGVARSAWSTHEALVIEVDRVIDADHVGAVLDRLGPEFIAHAIDDWCRFNGTGAMLIGAGSPRQNAWIESFNGRLGDELFNGWRFDSLLEARVIIEEHRADDNDHRPHSAHGDLTPTEFA